MNIDYSLISATDTELKSILSNVRTLASTPKGTAPFLRDMGIDKYVPEDLNKIHQNEYISNVLSQAETYEDRVSITSISFDGNDVNIVLGGVENN